MMANYIDREAMLEQITRRESLMVGDKMISIDALRAFIMNRPIADVEEVKHGHWIYYPECGVTKCSVCHRSVEECVEYPRCMFCGAYMDEGTKMKILVDKMPKTMKECLWAHRDARGVCLLRRRQWRLEFVGMRGLLWRQVSISERNAEGGR